MKLTFLKKLKGKVKTLHEKHLEKKANKKPSKIAQSKFYQAYVRIINEHDFLVLIPWSLFLDFILEWMSRHSFLSACDFVIHHPIPYLYNSFLIMTFYSVAILFRRRKFVRRVISGIFVALGITNCILLLNRVSPFGFTDLNMIGDLLTMQDSKYFSAGQAFLAMSGIIVFGLFLVNLFIHGPKKKDSTPFWVRLLIVIAMAVALPTSGKALQNAKLIDSYFGNLAQGYLNNGYLYGFATSIIDRGMSKPLGYSRQAVQKIVSNDQASSTESTVDGKSGPNVIVVLLESYFDPSEANYIETSEDPIPFFHSLEANYSTGHLTVPVLGAGTCNSEFEMLTGMSCSFFGPGEYPQKTVLKKQDVESYADAFKDLGYSAHVVHNNGGNFYSRANAFSKMGFDTFTSKEMLDITEYTPLGSWPTDDVLIQGTKDAMDSTKTKDFVYTITVSTHGNYPDYKVLDDPAIKVTAKGKDQGTQYKWEYYINQLHTLDTWMKNYVDMLNSRGEDTLLIMFGDHLPTMGLTSDEVATGDLFKTKYVTWNNFGLSKQDADLTSYQLVAEQMNRIGVHQGTMTQYNQTMIKNGVLAGSNQYMSGLKMLQYDLLYGKRYAYNGVDLYPASDLIMGIHDVTVNRAYYFNGKVHIYGDNFTKWSKVFVNGKKVSTAYVSGQCLTIDDDSIKDGDTLVVNQMGSSDTIFRSSNKYTYSSTLATDEEQHEEDPTDSTTIDTETSD